MNGQYRQRGSLLITAIVILVTLALLSAVATRLFITQARSGGDFNRAEEAQLLAESGMEKAKYELSQTSTYTGEINTAFANGSFTITLLYTDFDGLALPTGQARISSTGTLTAAAGLMISRTVEEIITVPILSGWAGGTNGLVLRWDSTQWLAMTTPFTFNINDVNCSSSASDCWFVGDGGIIAHWDGLIFSSAAVTTENMNAVACAPNNANLCFAVGNGGTIETWEGRTWTTST